MLDCMIMSSSTDTRLSSHARTRKIAQYPSSLYAAMGDDSVPEHARVLAAVSLKNCLAKFWRRKLGVGGLSDEDKARMREQFIGNLNIGNTPAQYLKHHLTRTVK